MLEQVRESATWPHSDGEAGASKDSMLAQADQLLNEGQLSAAAAVLRTAVGGALCRLACLAGQVGTGDGCQSSDVHAQLVESLGC